MPGPRHGTKLVAHSALLLIAGHETTANLIANATLALLRNPGELARLRAQPDLAASAVEEFLRYDGTVAGISRQAKEDVRLSGGTVRTGEVVMAVLPAAIAMNALLGRVAVDPGLQPGQRGADADVDAAAEAEVAGRVRLADRYRGLGGPRRHQPPGERRLSANRLNHSHRPSASGCPLLTPTPPILERGRPVPR